MISAIVVCLNPFGTGKVFKRDAGDAGAGDVGVLIPSEQGKCSNALCFAS